MAVCVLRLNNAISTISHVSYLPVMRFASSLDVKLAYAKETQITRAQDTTLEKIVSHCAAAFIATVRSYKNVYLIALAKVLLMTGVLTYLYA